MEPTMTDVGQGDPENSLLAARYELDANDSFAMTLSFRNGALGVVHSTRWAPGHMNDLPVRVYGDKGAVEVQHREGGSPHLLACLGDDVETGTWKQLTVDPVQTNFQRFTDAVRIGTTLDPLFRHAARIQEVLDLANLTQAERREFSLSIGSGDREAGPGGLLTA
jgi:predicted dehydrogenase